MIVIAKRVHDQKIIDVSGISKKDRFLYSGRIYEDLITKKRLCLKAGDRRSWHFAEVSDKSGSEKEDIYITSTFHNEIRDFISTFDSIKINGVDFPLTFIGKEKQTISLKSSFYPIRKGFNSSIGDILFKEMVIEVICTSTFSLEKQGLVSAIDVPFFLIDMGIPYNRDKIKSCVKDKAKLKEAIEECGVYIEDLPCFIAESEARMNKGMVDSIKQSGSFSKGYVLKYNINGKTYYVVDKRKNASKTYTSDPREATEFGSVADAKDLAKKLTKYPVKVSELGKEIRLFLKNSNPA